MASYYNKYKPVALPNGWGVVAPGKPIPAGTTPESVLQLDDERKATFIDLAQSAAKKLVKYATDTDRFSSA